MLSNSYQQVVDRDEQYTVYLAGPIQHAEDSGQNWRSYVRDTAAFDVANPLDVYDPDDDQTPTPTEIVESDLRLIDESDAMFVYDDGTTSHGTPMEQFHAYTSYMPVVVAWDTDTELSPWTQYHADYVRSNVGRAVDALEQHLADEGVRTPTATAHTDVGDHVPTYDAESDIETLAED